MKRLILLVLSVTILMGIFFLSNGRFPYSDRVELLSASISIDSIWSLGPTTTIYDKTSRKYYWLKSLTSLDQTVLDTLKSRKASIRYVKGPLENRIFRMDVDSIVVIDQIVERE